MSITEVPAPPWIIGHRGAAGEACENTLSSLRRGVQAGADMVELDVQLAADKVPVCFHDWDLDRLAGRSEIVEKEPSALLTEVTLSSDGDRMPTLAAALEIVPEKALLNVELKRRAANPKGLATAVLEVLDNRSRVLVSSFDWELLEVVRQLAPDLPLAPIARYRPGDLISVGRKLQAFSLHCHHRLVTQHFVERAAADGFERIFAYTVNETDQARRLLAEGISGFFTDLPTIMVKHFRNLE